VGIEVGHYHTDWNVEGFFLPQIEKYFRWEKMGAQGKIGILLLDQFHQGACIEPIQSQSPFLELPRTVKGLVEPAEKVRPTGHELHIEIGINLSKDGIRVPEDFDMTRGNPLCVKRRNKRIRRAKMASGGGSGQNHYGIWLWGRMFCHLNSLLVSAFRVA
jgi:hypothetical protein